MTLGSPTTELEGASLSVDSWQWLDVTNEDVTNDGSADASGDLEALVADNRLLILPPGTYLFDNILSIDDVENFGLYAPQGGVTFTRGDGINDGQRLVDVGQDTPVTNFLFKGIDTDVATTHFMRCDGSGVIEDVEVTVQKTTNYNNFGVTCPEEGRKLVLRDIRMPNGAQYLDTGDLTVGIYVKDTHAGTLRVEDCHVEGFPNNGLYASVPGGSGNGDGRIIVEGGLYKNNGVAGVRIGGHSSVIRDVDFEHDTRPTDFASMRGARLRRGDGHVVENCEFVWNIGETVTNATAVQIHNDVGEATVRDCTIEMNDGNMAFYIQGESSPDIKDRVTLDNVHIYGTGGTGDKGYALRLERQNIVMRDCTLDMPNKTFAAYCNGVSGMEIVRGQYDTDNTYEWDLNAGEDVNFQMTEPVTWNILDDGTRTRWNGVIGGGPLGGVDLSSVSGQYDGDRAVSSSGNPARWDADNSQWLVYENESTTAPA